MDLELLAYNLYDTPLSTGIRMVTWLIPAVQSVHILAIAILVGSAMVMELRLAGVMATDVATRTVVKRHLPWLWSALGVLVLTGGTLMIAEPQRVLGNTVFWWKMTAVFGAFVLTLLFRLPILRPQFQLDHAWWRALVKPTAWLSMAAWIFAIFCGRWIAYAL